MQATATHPPLSNLKRTAVIGLTFVVLVVVAAVVAVAFAAVAVRAAAPVVAPVVARVVVAAGPLAGSATFSSTFGTHRHGGFPAATATGTLTWPGTPQSVVYVA